MRRATSLRREIADGTLLVMRDAYLRVLSVYGAAANLALSGYSALLVVFLVRDIGLAPASVGLLTAIPGVGGILGALITGRVTARWARPAPCWCARSAPFLSPCSSR